MDQNIKNGYFSDSVANVALPTEKANKCNQCDCTFSLASNLRRHLKTHSREKSSKPSIDGLVLALCWSTPYFKMDNLRYCPWDQICSNWMQGLVIDGSYTNGTRTVLGNFDNGLKGDQCSQFAAMQDIFWMQSANVVQEGIVKCTWKTWKTWNFAFVPSAFCANSTRTSLTPLLCSEVNVINAKNCVLLQRCTLAVSTQSTSFPANKITNQLFLNFQLYVNLDNVKISIWIAGGI